MAVDDADDQRAWFEQELADLYAREAQYRAELGRQWATSTRLRAHTRSLYELLRRCPPLRAELTEALVGVARLSARALGVARTSVWLFDPPHEALRCVLELRDFTPVDTDPQTLLASTCPSYIAALQGETALAVSDVFRDPNTSELSAYFRQHQIGALLDIPIVAPGDLLGVVCHEHVGGPRSWELEEIDFAANVASSIALALETERRLRAESNAHSMEAKYQHLVESLPVTVYSFDYRSNRLDYVSPQGLELGEFTSREALLERGANAWIERVHPADRAWVAARLAKGGAAGGLPLEVTYRICLPSGKTRTVRDTGRIVRRADGVPIAVQGVLSDVSEQAEAEAARDEFERRYRALLESVDLVSCTLDAQGCTTFVNDAFLRMSGYRREELLGCDWFERMVPEAGRADVRARYLRNIERGSLVPRFELQVQTRSGKRRQLLCANTILRDAGGTVTGSASLALDVTDQRAFSDALLQQTKLESLGRLAAGIAHDFNNLLTVLLGQTSLLKEGIGRDDPRAYASMEQALEQASQLTQALLAYGRRQPRQRAATRLDVVIEETRALLAAIAARRVSLTMSLQAKEARVRVDPVELRQVLINLVGNAVDAIEAPQGAVRITTHVELLGEEDARAKGLLAGGEHAILCVIDNGPGIDPAQLGQIFEPFFTTKREGRGTGLGLAVVQSIVNAASGAVEVKSDKVSGTTFRVFLPLEATVNEHAGADGARGAVVVVVVAGEDVHSAIVAPLARAGYDVFYAADIKGATRLLSSTTRVGLLIAGETLDDGLGVALARTVKTMHPGTPVIMLAPPDSIDDAFDGYLAQPIDSGRLLTVVGGLVASRT